MVSEYVNGIESFSQTPNNVVVTRSSSRALEFSVAQRNLFMRGITRRAAFPSRASAHAQENSASPVDDV
jgi:hypothetical protein